MWCYYCDEILIDVVVGFWGYVVYYFCYGDIVFGEEGLFVIGLWWCFLCNCSVCFDV